ncbi:MAG: hypothetical protein AB1480_16555 [Nitrospirota bacterium]
MLDALDFFPLNCIGKTTRDLAAVFVSDAIPLSEPVLTKNSMRNIQTDWNLMYSQIQATIGRKNRVTYPALVEFEFLLPPASFEAYIISENPQEFIPSTDIIHIGKKRAIFKFEVSNEGAIASVHETEGSIYTDTPQTYIPDDKIVSGSTIFRHVRRIEQRKKGRFFDYFLQPWLNRGSRVRVEWYRCGDTLFPKKFVEAEIAQS